MFRCELDIVLMRTATFEVHCVFAFRVLHEFVCVWVCKWWLLNALLSQQNNALEIRELNKVVACFT